MNRGLGKLIYCSICWRSFQEKQKFPENVECKGCLEVIEELVEWKEKQKGLSKLSKKGKRK